MARYYRFNARDDWRTCAWCRSMDGAIVHEDDWGSRPPLHDNCRCSESFEYEDDDNAGGGGDDGGGPLLPPAPPGGPGVPGPF